MEKGSVSVDELGRVDDAVMSTRSTAYTTPGALGSTRLWQRGQTATDSDPCTV